MMRAPGALLLALLRPCLASRLHSVGGLRVLALSDLHGPCRSADGSQQNITARLAAFDASLAGQAVAGSGADVLIFGGDLSMIPRSVTCTPQQFQEMGAFLRWFGALPPATKILLPGNHDACLDEAMDAVAFDSELVADMRREMMRSMQELDIVYLGPVGWARVPLASGGAFKILSAAFSEGRTPGARSLEPPEFGGITPPLGAFQYCSPRAEQGPGLVDCKETYEAALATFRKAARELGGAADLVVMHGPPDNVGTKFGPALEEVLSPGFAREVAGALLDKGRLLAGHYHPASDWRGGARRQWLRFDEAKEVEMLFMPVKAQRPERCEEGQTDEDHMPLLLHYEGKSGPVGGMESGVVAMEPGMAQAVRKNWCWDRAKTTYHVLEGRVEPTVFKCTREKWL